MSSVARWLALDRARWERLGSRSWQPALAIVVVTAALLAFARFGGLAAHAPRAFVRLTLVTVWGWVGLALAMTASAVAAGARRPVIGLMFAVAGIAHLPLLVLTGVVIVSAVLAQVLGPGTVVAVAVLAFWMPASLARGAQVVGSLPPARALATAATPYVVWLAIVARHVIGHIEHLL